MNQMFGGVLSVVVIVIIVVSVVFREKPVFQRKPEIVKRNRKITSLIAKCNRGETLSGSEKRQLNKWEKEGLISIGIGIGGSRIPVFVLSLKAVAEEIDEVSNGKEKR